MQSKKVQQRLKSDVNKAVMCCNCSMYDSCLHMAGNMTGSPYECVTLFKASICLTGNDSEGHAFLNHSKI